MTLKQSDSQETFKMGGYSGNFLPKETDSKIVLQILFSSHLLFTIITFPLNNYFNRRSSKYFSP